MHVKGLESIVGYYVVILVASDGASPVDHRIQYRVHRYVGHRYDLHTFYPWEVEG